MKWVFIVRVVSKRETNDVHYKVLTEKNDKIPYSIRVATQYDRIGCLIGQVDLIKNKTKTE